MQLRLATGMTSNALTKLGKDESVQLDILVKICEGLDCDITDIVEIKKNSVFNFEKVKNYKIKHFTAHFKL